MTPRGVGWVIALLVAGCGARSHSGPGDAADGDSDSDSDDPPVGLSGVGADLALGDLTSTEWRSLCEWAAAEFAGCEGAGTGFEDCMAAAEFWIGCDATVRDYETCLRSAVACEANPDDPACGRLASCFGGPSDGE